MKLLQVFNDYRSMCGGEGTVVQMIDTLMAKHGHQTRLLTRSSKGLDRSLIGRIQAVASGIYNRKACREMAELLTADRPDIVHAHNLYPLLSPSVLVACRRAGVPVVMTSHNYMLTCPIVSHLHKGRVCEKCLGGREYWAVLQNCRENLAESAVYAVRSVTARKAGFFRNDVTIHIVLSNFAKARLVKEGFDAERIVVLPNMVELGPESVGRGLGEYVAFSGRMKHEKGVDVLLEAAARLPDVPFRLAGDGPLLEKLKEAAPPNVQFMNRLGPEQMSAFYQGARFLVVPSRWFEGCPLVVSEAMSHKLPVIASRIGGLPEFVDDGTTGLLFEHGDRQALAGQIRKLWDNRELCLQMGNAGRKKAEREYNEETYFQRLMSIYEQAVELNGQDLAVREGRRAPPLQVVGTADESDVLREKIGQLAAERGELSILEAGCGNTWQLRLPGVRYVLTGVDLNADALEIRKTQRRDLDIAIQGDLRSVELDEKSYDVIYNSFVLEHVDGAEQVLDNFHRWLRPGGILILRIPDPRSVYGMLSRITPFWFHVFYKRHIAGVKTAGKPGYDPFPVVYDKIVCRTEIRRWCAARGLILREELGWNYQIGRPGLMSLVVRAGIRTLSLLSLGRLSAKHVNLTYVIEKPALVETIGQRTTNDQSQLSRRLAEAE